jgi:hypothetical protein
MPTSNFRATNNHPLLRSLSRSIVPIGCLLIFAFRITQIWLNPTDDFDTSSFILVVQGGFYPTAFFFDIAHPGLLSAVLKICQLIKIATHLPAIYIWSTLISLGLALACITLFYLMKALKCSNQVSYFTCFVYMISPAVSDVAARSEENILFHSPMMLTLMLCLFYIKRQSLTLLMLVAVSALILAAQHIQPFLIVSAGLMLFLASELWRSKGQVGTEVRAALKLFLTLTAIGFVFYVAMHYAFYNPMVVRAYSNNFFSILHNDSFIRYVKAYLLFAQGYLFTGELPINYATNVGVDPRGPIYLLGIGVTVCAFILSNRRRFTDCFILPALGFAFLYEPSASERWDTLVIAMVISLMSRLDDVTQTGCDSNKFYRPRMIWIPLTIAILLNGYALRGQLTQIVNTNNAQSSMGYQLGPSKVVYSDLDSARQFVSRGPRDIELQNIDVAQPKLGDAIFLKNGPEFAKDKFKFRCTPTTISDLCVIR